MADTYFNYFTEIEERFQRARGVARLLSPRDWALIERWKRDGIPLEAVLRGIDAAFEKWRARPARARFQMVNSVAYCAQAVAEEAQSMAARAPVRCEVTPSFSLEDVRRYLQHNAAVLRTAGHGDLAESLDRLNIGELFPDLEQLDQRLTFIEEKMIARVRAASSEEALLEARRALNQEMKPYLGKMTTDQLTVLEKQFLDRRLLEKAGLPRLGLFYFADSRRAP